ncbi:MAG TPA: ABC transporter substrate-binding protein, partial [Acidimicrobiales bacterium]|nr:ABC transporter substrate-binding protein [Acidimicrobiales bacterium]
AVAALLLGACVARVPPYFPAAQVAPGSGPTGSGGGAVGGGSNQATGTPTTLSSLGIGSSGGGAGGAGAGAGGAGTGGSGGGATPAAAVALTPSTFNLNPQAEAGYCPASSANKASDVGVTPTSINIGNVSGLSGILSNNFNQGPEAVQALFSSVNAAGGICGRKLNLQVEDDGQDPSHNAADIQDLIPKSFAFVGSTSDADNGGVPAMQQAGIPDIGQAINFERGANPSYFTAGTFGAQQKGGSDYIYDTLASGLKANGHFPTKMAFLAFNIPISSLAARQFVKVFQAAGSQDCYEDENVSPASPNLTSDVLTMEQRGCDGVFTTMDVTGNAKLMQAMYNQGYHPTYAGTTLDGYTPAQISVAGQQQAQGFQVFLNFEPFNEAQPGVNLYLSQLRTYEPGKQPSAFGIEAWASAQLLLYALIKSGPNPTRASVKSIISGLSSWDTAGAMAPSHESTRSPGNCLVDLQIKGNDFVRVWPSSGFFCSNNLVAVPAS